MITSLEHLYILFHEYTERATNVDAFTLPVTNATCAVMQLKKAAEYSYSIKNGDIGINITVRIMGNCFSVMDTCLHEGMNRHRFYVMEGNAVLKDYTGVNQMKVEEILTKLSRIIIDFTTRIGEEDVVI